MQGNWRQKYLRYKSYLLNTVDRYKERTDVKIYLEILLSLVTISVFSVFALRPTILTIAELIKEIEAKEELVAKLDNKIDTITKAQILYDRGRENIQLLKKAIPASPETDTLTYQLEGLVERNNLQAQVMSIGETTILGAANTNQDNSDSSIPFNIRLSGEYPTFYQFLDDIEKLSKPIRLQSTSIFSTEDKKTGERRLILTLKGQTPYKIFDK